METTGRLPQNAAVPPPPPAVGNEEDSSDDELGPNFGAINGLAAPGALNAGGAVSSVQQVHQAFRTYERHTKGYVHSSPLSFSRRSFVSFSVKVINDNRENERANERLKKKYDADPRVFFNQSDVRTELPSLLIDFAIFIFSLQSSSANCERSFSRMGWMISSRRAGITADNADKRLTLCNQLPQKRRLLDFCKSRKIKRTKLEETLFSSK